MFTTPVLTEALAQEKLERFALLGLSSLADPFSLPILISSLAKERYLADKIRAIGNIGGSRAEDTLLKIFQTNPKEFDVWYTLFDALEKVGGPKTVEILKQYLLHNDYFILNGKEQVRLKNVPRVLGKIGTPAAIRLLWETSLTNGALRQEARVALRPHIRAKHLRDYFNSDLQA